SASSSTGWLVDPHEGGWWILTMEVQDSSWSGQPGRGLRRYGSAVSGGNCRLRQHLLQVVRAHHVLPQNQLRLRLGNAFEIPQNCFLRLREGRVEVRVV